MDGWTDSIYSVNVYCSCKMFVGVQIDSYPEQLKVNVYFKLLHLVNFKLYLNKVHYFNLGGDGNL